METDYKPVRVAARYTHAAALEEACRRLQVMHSKWPATAWRMRVKRERRLGSRHTLWAIYALVPRS